MSLSASNAARLVRAPGRLLARTGLIAMLLIGVVGGVIAAVALAGLEHEMRQELEREAQVLVQLAAAPLQRALDLGTPFAALTGMTGLLRDASGTQRNIGYLALCDTAGMLRSAAGSGIERIARLPPPREAEGVRLRSAAGGYDIALPLHDRDGAAAGWLHLGIDREAMATSSFDIGWDIVIVLLFSVLVTIELLRFAVHRTVIAPLALVERVASRIAQGDWTVRADIDVGDEAGWLLGRINVTIRRVNDRWARLTWLAGEVGAAGGRLALATRAVLGGVTSRFRFGDSQSEVLPPDAAVVRLSLFGFVIAEQFSTSFVALDGRELAGPDAAAWLSALPIAVFFAAAAIAAPFGAHLVARHGVRACILTGTATAMLGHLGAALAGSVAQFAAARFLAGIGYPIVTIACQLWLSGVTSEGRLARSLGGFVGTMMTAAVCGTAMGAVFADCVGYSATFLLSAMVVLAVPLATWKALPTAKAGANGLVWRQARRTFGCLPFSALVLLAAIPAKGLFAGFILYLAPVALDGSGFGPAAIGRNVMLYGLAMLPALPLGAWLAERTRTAVATIVLAGIVGGIALLLPGMIGSEWTLPAAIALAGFARGGASAPMRSLIPRLAANRFETPTALALLRLGEGIGGVAGPLAAAALVTTGQPMSSIGVFGGFAIATAAGYGLLHLFTCRCCGARLTRGGAG